VAASLLSIVLLMLSNTSWNETRKVAAVAAGMQETTVNEVEPNDDPLHAQEVPFPQPGERIVIRGDAADGDKGFFSEEAEQFFSYFGGFGKWQDVYLLDPDKLQDTGDGPIPLRFKLSWDQTVDMDMMVGTLVDSNTFFFDGFKILSDIQMTNPPEVNPENWPRTDAKIEAVALYLQPKGIVADGKPIPNDSFGRKLLLIVKNFDRTRANYIITVEREGGILTVGTEGYQVDDGTLSVRFFSRPAGAFVVNRFRPSHYPARLTAISHPFVRFENAPDPTGKPIRVIVFAGDSDAPDTTPPSNPTLLFDKVIPIPRTISPEPGSFYIGDVVEIPIDPPVTINSGVIYVGLQLPSDPVSVTGVALGLDVSPVQYLRTYVSQDSGATWGRPTGTEDISGETVFLNAAIRSIFSFGTEIQKNVILNRKPSNAVVKVESTKDAFTLKPITH